MILTLVTPPVGPVVPLSDLKAHLRVDHDEEDALITSLEAAAVGYLDGWGGILGRAIKTQVWQQEFLCWGTLELALPDVLSVAVTCVDSFGQTVPAVSADLRSTATGQVVEANGVSSNRIFVAMTCAMPAPKLAIVQLVVKMLVEAWFADRAPGEFPKAADALISTLRARRV